MKWFVVAWVLIGLIVFLSEWQKLKNTVWYQKLTFFLVVGPAGWIMMLIHCCVNWREVTGDFLLFLFCWSGAKLFSVISFYSPDEITIQTVHFSRSEGFLKESCEKLVDEMRNIE